MRGKERGGEGGKRERADEGRAREERGGERGGEGRGGEGRRGGGRELTFLMGGVPFLILRRSLIILLSFCSSGLSDSSSTSSCEREGGRVVTCEGRGREGGREGGDM